MSGKEKTRKTLLESTFQSIEGKVCFLSGFGLLITVLTKVTCWKLSYCSGNTVLAVNGSKETLKFVDGSPEVCLRWCCLNY